MFKKIILFLSFAFVSQCAFSGNSVELGSGFNSGNLPNILFDNYKKYIEKNNITDTEVTRLNFLVDTLTKYLEPENEYYQIFSQQNLLESFAKKFEIEKLFLINFDKNYKPGDYYIHWLIRTEKLNLELKYKNIKNLLVNDVDPNVLDAENKTPIDLVLKNNFTVEFAKLFCDFKVNVYPHTYDLLKDYEPEDFSQETWIDIFEKFKNNCKDCEEISKDVKTEKNVEN
jgi:hypothetical protein